MKIVLLDKSTLGDADLNLLNKLGDFVSYDITSKEETIERLKDADIAITNKVIIDKHIMQNCKKLKLICIAATGMNNVDLDFAKRENIVVKNAVGYSTPSVVQSTFTMLFTLVGNSCYYDNYVKSKEWSKSPIFTNLDREFFEIKDKTWGIIGLGNIGRAVAEIATVFGTNIIYYSTSGVDRDKRYKRKTLIELLEESDIISIHAPLNENSNNLIKKEELSKMKKGAIILNMGRGGIINEEDLAYAIDNFGILAGLDVSKIEPIQKTNPLLHVEKRESLIFSPHIAWASKESRKRLVEIVAKNIENFLKGESNGKRT